MRIATEVLKRWFNEVIYICEKVVDYFVRSIGSMPGGKPPPGCLAIVGSIRPALPASGKGRQWLKCKNPAWVRT
jgi:hypothetical protein